MKSFLRETLALLLCAALCVSLFPAAFAEGSGFTLPDGSVIETVIANPDPVLPAEEIVFGDADTAEFAAADAELFAVPNAEASGVFTIPAGVTRIEAEAFSGVTGMRSVVIPVGVTEIGAGAFEGCTNLSAIRFEGTPAQWNKVTIGMRNAPLQRTVFYFSDGSHWIPVTDTFFPDPVFRAFVTNHIDTNKDGYLTDYERSAVLTINCAGTEENRGSIQSLRGVELFGSLKTLSCAYNKLSALDVTKNTALETLYCQDNSLTSLDLTQNTKLRQLSCSTNKLSVLDLRSCPALETVYAHYNSLTSLDLSKNTALTGLYIAYNGLAQLNLRANTRLTGLEILHNGMSALDVSSCTALQKLYCGQNNLQSLYLSNNTQLNLLDCHENSLTALELRWNTALEDLNAAQNLLKSLSVSSNTRLERLQCYSNRLTALTLGTNSVLDRLNCADNPLTTLDIRNCAKLIDVYGRLAPVYKNGVVYHMTDLNSPYLIYNQSVTVYAGTTPTPTPPATGIPITAQYFPDSVFRSMVYQYCDANKDYSLSASEIRNTTVIHCANSAIRTLQGIEYFTNLQSLHCNNTYITSLDLSAFPYLRQLKCYDTGISTLYVGSNPYLANLVKNTNPSYTGDHVLFEANGCLLEYTFGVRVSA